jgi:hypothetical protein
MTKLFVLFTASIVFSFYLFQGLNDPLFFYTSTPFGDRVTFAGSPPDMSGAMGRPTMV